MVYGNVGLRERFCWITNLKVVGRMKPLKYHVTLISVNAYIHSLLLTIPNTCQPRCEVILSYYSSLTTHLSDVEAILMSCWSEVLFGSHNFMAVVIYFVFRTPDLRTAGLRCKIYYVDTSSH